MVMTMDRHHIIKIFGNGIRQLMYGQGKPTFQEIQKEAMCVFQSGQKVT